MLTVDIKRDIQQRIGDELADVGLLDVPIEYHMTSIFDHSIFEAFSKIIQKLIPQLHTLQDLLNNLVDVTPSPSTTVSSFVEMCLCVVYVMEADGRRRISRRRFCLMSSVRYTSLPIGHQSISQATKSVQTSSTSL